MDSTFVILIILCLHFDLMDLFWWNGIDDLVEW